MRRPDHLPALDGLRALAILMVLVFHWFQLAPPPAGVARFLWRASVAGQTGVDLFFVLSGFLITRNLLAERHTERYFRNFYGRRVLRIFPLYYAYLVVWLLATPITSKGAANAAWFLTYLQNVPLTFGWPLHGPTHFWSLAVEEHFYLVWPALLLAFSARRIPRLALALIAVAIASRLLLISGGFSEFYFTLCRADSLAVGAAIAGMEAEGVALERLRSGMMAAVAVATLVAVELFVPIAVKRSLTYTLVALVYASSIVWCVTQARATRVLTFRPLRFIGRISYGVYVLHPLIFDRVSALLGWGTAAAFAAFTLTIAAAAASFYCFERPFLRLKRHFRSHRPAAREST